MSDHDRDGAGDDAHDAGRARHGARVALLTLLVGVGAIDARFRASGTARQLRGESLYYSKAAAFSASDGADVAITGDSRTLHGVSPHVIEQGVRLERGETIVAYNAGLSGAPPMAQCAWVRRLLTARRRPRVVLMSISPYMFSTRIAHDPSRESLTTIWRLQDLPTMLRAGAPADDLATVLSVNLLELVRQRPRVLEILLHHSDVHASADIGDQGFIENAEGDPASQRVRGHGRAIGYRTEMWPPARFGNEQVGYFTEALRALHAAGVQTVVVNSQAASQIDEAYGPASLYAQHIAFVRAQAQRFGARYFDAEHGPAIRDADFVDGDHLGRSGAERFSAWLTHEVVVPALGGRRTDRPAACHTVFDFERANGGGVAGWVRNGTAMSDAIAAQGRRMQAGVFGYTGGWFLDTFAWSYGDAAEGDAVSPPFVLDGNSVRVRVGGGSGTDVGVMLMIDAVQVAIARGQDAETLRDVVWDVTAHRGQRATIRVQDRAQGGWGHILLDDVAVCP
jgi:hypothetical protein